MLFRFVQMFREIGEQTDRPADSSVLSRREATHRTPSHPNAVAEERKRSLERRSLSSLAYWLIFGRISCSSNCWRSLPSRAVFGRSLSIGRQQVVLR